MKDDRWLVCPLCSWGKKMITDRQINTLDKTDIVNGPFIDHRDTAGGRGSGFPRKYFERLNDIKSLPEYAELISGLRDQCKKILAIIGE